MQDPILFVTNQPIMEKEPFKTQFKLAKKKSAIIAAIPTLVIVMRSLGSPPFWGDIFIDLMFFLLTTGVPFILLYHLLLYLGFARKLVPFISQDAFNQYYGPIWRQMLSDVQKMLVSSHNTEL